MKLIVLQKQSGNKNTTQYCKKGDWNAHRLPVGIFFIRSKRIVFGIYPDGQLRAAKRIQSIYQICTYYSDGRAA